MSDEHTEIEKIIYYYTKEIADNRSQIETIIKNFASKVDLSVVRFAIDYAKLKNKGEISFIIDTLNEWIRFDLTTEDKVKNHLGLSISSKAETDNISEASSNMVMDIEKEEIIREFKKKIGNRIGIEKELMELFKEVEPKVVKLCIDYCCSNKKTNLPSFLEVMNQWKADGLTKYEKAYSIFMGSNITPANASKTIKHSNNTGSKGLDSKVSKSSTKLNNLKSSTMISNLRDNKEQVVFNEDSFNQIEFYYRKYFNNDDVEVNGIKEFCHHTDNSLVPCYLLD